MIPLSRVVQGILQRMGTFKRLTSMVSELIRGDIYFWGQLMAGALLGSIPVALVYSFFVEHYVSGLTGSVKG